MIQIGKVHKNSLRTNEFLIFFPDWHFFFNLEKTFSCASETQFFAFTVCNFSLNLEKTFSYANLTQFFAFIFWHFLDFI